ncbi:MAG: hypothetical protein A2075_08285 [Geobacteraceae bacterium GWC2_58_44]|nr:MAG: hypothetical protein A2075_08285 [Geobacteraceae bacterium GWC2_58_44]
MKLFAAVLVGFAGISGVASAADLAEPMEFPGKKGTVLFYHQKHVSLVQGDCRVCHDRPGEIKGFGRAIAHKMCIGCHEPEAGKLGGPITCDGCHTPM